MFKTTVTAAQWSLKNIIKPSKPTFSMSKIKEKLAEYYSAHEAERLKTDENKKLYPRIHQSVQSTAWELIKYYLKHWGKANAANCEIRITHSYLRRALNDSCCVATLKNHINKLLRMSNPFIKTKYRGGLGLTDQNTPCIVLVLDKNVLLFADERHNAAIGQDEVAREETYRKSREKAVFSRKAAQQIINLETQAKNDAERRMNAPSSIENIIKNIFGGVGKRE
jgi:hypothetical protein